MRANATRDTGLPCLGAVGPRSGGVGQGRHHGFESGGDNFASGASKKNFFDPPLFGQWGGQNIA